jgi:acid phosphatase family membrane protein YuiD
VVLRERMGHTLVEIGGGIATGIGMGFLIHALFGA